MRTEREQAWAKLNLALDVLDPLPDGYHGMRMIMLSCTLRDEVRVTLTPDGSFEAHSNLYYLPCDGRNITVKAAKLFFEELGEKKFGVRVDMKKRIPVCAGLGGGSADAAAVLRALNRITGAGFTAGKLEEMGLRLGADVPFCVRGGTCLAEGRGEVLTRLPQAPDCGIVICKPRFPISTPELFSRIDARERGGEPDMDSLCAAMADGDLPALAAGMRNVFEQVLSPSHAEIFAIKRRLMDCGALGSLMTGTGSAVFGLFADPEEAKKCAEILSRDYRECFFAQPKDTVRV
ncbi:MAG: 4-(cytidine 5'-diphospho)-2-C-methyl-D-erythritol kinase [Candidatus Heteroscillospira sp.]|jgi:4-diphosphocytidyl-2-C-methyl-D-erythritol kinase